MNDEDTKNSEIDSQPIKSDWTFCPVCGIKLLTIPNLKFCTNCGTNLEYIKQHKKFPASQISYGTPKLSDEGLINNKEHKLWPILQKDFFPMVSQIVQPKTNPYFGFFIEMLRN